MPGLSAPSLLLNATSAETGQRVAFAPYSLIGVGDGTLHAFGDLGRMLRVVGRSKREFDELELIDAAVTSARFPGILPAWSIAASGQNQVRSAGEVAAAQLRRRWLSRSVRRDDRGRHRRAVAEVHPGTPAVECGRAACRAADGQRFIARYGDRRGQQPARCGSTIGRAKQCPFVAVRRRCRSARTPSWRPERFRCCASSWIIASFRCRSAGSCPASRMASSRPCSATAARASGRMDDLGRMQEPDENDTERRAHGLSAFQQLVNRNNCAQKRILDLLQ